MKNIFLLSNNKEQSLHVLNLIQNKYPNFINLKDYLSNWEINPENNETTKDVYTFNDKLNVNNIYDITKFPKQTNNEKYNEKIRNWKVWCLENSSQQNNYLCFFNLNFINNQPYKSTLEVLWNNNLTFTIDKDINYQFINYNDIINNIENFLKELK